MEKVEREPTKLEEYRVLAVVFDEQSLGSDKISQLTAIPDHVIWKVINKYYLFIGLQRVHIRGNLSVVEVYVVEHTRDMLQNILMYMAAYLREEGLLPVIGEKSLQDLWQQKQVACTVALEQLGGSFAERDYHSQLRIFTLAQSYFTSLCKVHESLKANFPKSQVLPDVLALLKALGDKLTEREAEISTWSEQEKSSTV